MKATRRAAALAGALFLSSACAHNPFGGVEARKTLASDLAASAGMESRVLDAGAFRLVSFVRAAQPGGPADVYIEGDGFAWVDRHTPSLDPTPTDPVALRLAAGDRAANVVWLARPCQYELRMTDGRVCPQTYWTNGRLAPETLDSMNGALDALKQIYGFSGYNLAGFSGGGGAAALLAAGRRDTLSLRTVAANLDNGLFSRLHHVSPMEGSVDPIGAAASVARLPQIHFVGRADKVAPPDLAGSFRAAAGSPQCLEIVTAEAGHDSSWAPLWPALLAHPLPCATPGDR